MLRLITGRSRSRLAAYGMLALLFVAGLAFSVFENTAGSRAMLSLGIGEDNETLAVPADPRLDPDDCLFDAEALKELTAVPHEQADATNTELPASHPAPSSTPSLTGDDGSPDAIPQGTTSGETPDGSSSGLSGDASDAGEDAPSKPPHVWSGEDECPAR